MANSPQLKPSATYFNFPEISGIEFLDVASLIHYSRNCKSVF
nr:MAG TPA: hypothetical protein [Caudoviricetes sp.]